MKFQNFKAKKFPYPTVKFANDQTVIFHASNEANIARELHYRITNVHRYDTRCIRVYN